MTAPTGQPAQRKYEASSERAQAFDDVYVARGQTASCAIIYYDGEKIYRTPVQYSGQYENDQRTYQYQFPDRNDRDNQVMRMSMHDAEVKTNQDVIEAVGELKKKGWNPKNVSVDIVTNNPTCGNEVAVDGRLEYKAVDGCKRRHEILKEDLKAALPSTESRSRPGKFHVKLSMHYYDFNRGPFQDGKRGDTVRYGYQEANLRTNDYTTTHNSTQYDRYYSHTLPSGMEGSTQKMYGPGPHTDKWSPVITPSPSHSDHARTPTPPELGGPTAPPAEPVAQLADQFAGMNVATSTWGPVATSQYPTTAQTLGAGSWAQVASQPTAYTQSTAYSQSTGYGYSQGNAYAETAHQSSHGDPQRTDKGKGRAKDPDSGHRKSRNESSKQTRKGRRK